MIAETLDTHIKAISTAEEWDKYKEMVDPPKVYDFVIDKIRAVGETYLFSSDPKRYHRRIEPVTIEDDDSLHLKLHNSRNLKTRTGYLNGINEDRPMEYKVDTTVLAEVGLGDHISKGWRDELVSEGCPESWFQPIEQVKEAQYWAWTDEGDIFRIQEMDDEVVYYKYLNNYRILSVGINYLTKHARKLSTHEIEEALIKEAKRRGLLTNGNKVATLANDGVAPSNIYNHVIPKDYHKICYNPDSDQLEMQLSSEFGDWIRLYKGGNWAEIVDQAIEINGKQIEVENDTVKISCGDTISEEMYKNFYAVVNKYDLDVSRNGEQINEQLQQIWDEMPQNLAGSPIELNVSTDDNYFGDTFSGTITFE